MTLYERPGDDISRGLVGFWKLDDLKRVATDGIVAHYKMNDNAADTVVVDSKSGNNGTASANTDTLANIGKINTSLRFDGLSGYVNVPHNSNQLLTGGGSICAWISPVTGGEHQAYRIVDKSTGINGNNGYGIWWSRDSNTLQIQINNGTIVAGATNSVPIDSGFYHVVVTWNSVGLVTHYVNGSASGTPTVSSSASGITTTNDLEECVSWQAIQAINQIGDRRVIDLLDRALKSKYPHIDKKRKPPINKRSL